MKPKLRLKVIELDRQMTLARIGSWEALARRMQMSPATVSRVLRNLQKPGPDFLAGLKQVFPEVCLDELFELVKDEAKASGSPGHLEDGSPRYRTLAGG